MRVKMCGMRTVAAARAAEEAGADYIGFIFAKNSRRYVAPETAQEIARALHRVRTVGVFVDAPMSDVNAIAGLVGLDYVQLHGHESAEMAQQAERPVIKAYRYGDDFSVEAANAYPAEMILVDSYVAGAAGGTGNCACDETRADRGRHYGGECRRSRGDLSAVRRGCIGRSGRGRREVRGKNQSLYGSGTKLPLGVALEYRLASSHLTNVLSSTRMGNTSHDAEL